MDLCGPAPREGVGTAFREREIITMRLHSLTFDLFGTILDLGGSLSPHIQTMLERCPDVVDTAEFWHALRERQRLEQYQDTLMLRGHAGYLETARRAFLYTLRRFGLHDLAADAAVVDAHMAAWETLRPFPDVLPALAELRTDYHLVVLSNGDPWFLRHLVTEQVGWPFDDVISVTDVGVFKPHPAVYGYAARRLGLDSGRICMVSSNSFDVVGARACGMLGAYVNRYGLPYEETPLRPTVEVPDFSHLRTRLRAWEPSPK